MINKMRAIALALALCSSGALAQECRYDGSQLEMNACAKRDYYESDRALNKAYYMRMQGLTQTTEREALISRQRDWLKRRDARCKFKKGGGSDATIEHFTCMQTMTDVRTMQLQVQQLMR